MKYFGGSRLKPLVGFHVLHFSVPFSGSDSVFTAIFKGKFQYSVCHVPMRITIFSTKMCWCRFRIPVPYSGVNSDFQVPVDPVSMKADVRATARAMSANTIMVYASSPSYPHGVIDPIQDLSRLAKKNGVRENRFFVRVFLGGEGGRLRVV